MSSNPVISKSCKAKLGQLTSFLIKTTDEVSAPQETEVIPDRKLLQQISRAQSGSNSSSGKIHPYLDFFLALAICNTVVVSMATAQRQRVSALFIVAVYGK